MAIECRLEIPKLPEEENVNLTVGREFLLHCSGDFSQMGQENLRIERRQTVGEKEEIDPYTVKLLSVEKMTSAEATFKVTSYRVGEREQLTLVLTDGSKQAEMKLENFTVASVIDPQNPPEGFYGTYGPFSLGFPLIYWVFLLAVLSLVVGGILYKWWKRSYRRRLLEQMRVYDGAQNPYFQFHHDIRKLLRAEALFLGAAVDETSVRRVIETLDTSYKMYLGREYLVPTLYFTDRQILRDFKKTIPNLYREHKDKFKKNLAELSRAKKNPGSLLKKDCEQMVAILRDHVESLEERKQREKNQGGAR